MTSESSTTTKSRTNGSTSTERGIQAAVSEVRGALGNVANSVPDVARASRTAVQSSVASGEGGPIAAIQVWSA